MHTKTNAAGFTLMEICICILIIGVGVVAVISVMTPALKWSAKARATMIASSAARAAMERMMNGLGGADTYGDYVVEVQNDNTAFEGPDALQINNDLGYQQILVFGCRINPDGTRTKAANPCFVVGVRIAGP